MEHFSNVFRILNSSLAYANTVLQEYHAITIDF